MKYTSIKEALDVLEIAGFTQNFPHEFIPTVPLKNHPAFIFLKECAEKCDKKIDVEVKPETRLNQDRVYWAVAACKKIVAEYDFDSFDNKENPFDMEPERLKKWIKAGAKAELNLPKPDPASLYQDKTPAPIPMLLNCPRCNAVHIDEGEFATKPHHTHACQICGMVWRPAVEHTIGVKFLPGFKNTSPEEKKPAEIVTVLNCISKIIQAVKELATYQPSQVKTPANEKLGDAEDMLRQLRRMV